MSAFEKHYSVPEVAELWGLSDDTVREIFKGKPGVFKLERRGSRLKRGYTTLCIPESLVKRVYAERTA